jgi:hypothetical protein
VATVDASADKISVQQAIRGQLKLPPYKPPAGKGGARHDAGRGESGGQPSMARTSSSDGGEKST